MLRESIHSDPEDNVEIDDDIDTFVPCSLCVEKRYPP